MSATRPPEGLGRPSGEAAPRKPGPKSVFTPAEACDEYARLGLEPPRWLLAQAGRAPRLSPDELTARAVECGVPEKYAGVEPDLVRAERLAAGTSFYVHGVSGDGKTTQAAALLKGWLDRGLASATWVTSVALLAQISDTYGGRGSEVAVVGSYARCGLLVLDDLGKERAGDWALSKLWWLVDERYANRRPTVITSQHGTGELAAIMAREGSEATAQAIVSRIRESYRGIDCGPTDRRLGGANGVQTAAGGAVPRQRASPQATGPAGPTGGGGRVG